MVALRVILFILKLLGILVLLLLGLALLVVLLGLFAPVRYKGKLKKQEETENALFADALVSWLNPLIRLRIRFGGEKRGYTVRLLGIRLFDSEKKNKKKTKKKQKEKRTRREKREEEPERRPEREQEPEHKPEREQEPECRPEESAAKTMPFAKENPEQEGGNENSAEPVVEEEPEESFSGKPGKIRERLKALTERIKETVRLVCARIKLLWRKKEAAAAFLEDETHTAAVAKAIKALKKVLLHILPGKLKGRVEFGTGNPETTGKALAALGILYAAYGKGITVIPDFNEKKFAAELTFRGRIRLGTLLVIVVRLIRDKQARGFYQDWKQLAGLLKEKAE